MRVELTMDEDEIKEALTTWARRFMVLREGYHFEATGVYSATVRLVKDAPQQEPGDAPVNP